MIKKPLTFNKREMLRATREALYHGFLEGADFMMLGVEDVMARIEIVERKQVSDEIGERLIEFAEMLRDHFGLEG